MKRILQPLILIIALLIVGNLFAGDRLMIIEFFTSSTCGPCASNNPILTAFMNSHDPEKITSIGYHMSWPAPGNDPMYLYNTGDNDGRRNYYGINSIPQGRFDGSIVLNSGYSNSTFQYYYDQNINILSPVSIILTDSAFATDSVKVRATVICETMLSGPVVVYVAVVENHIHYTSPPGSNGEMDFYTVMRKMLPSSSGTQLSLFPGARKVLEFKFRKDPVWNSNEIYVMAFAQNPTTKEMFTAARKTLNFTLLPNPGYKSVPQGQSSSAGFSIKVPVIASGYTSPITFSATVDPVTTGVNVTFPNGNVLSNFNDSLLMHVTSTASVPTGTYKILITGTNTNGKSHITAVNYLVGKNFVTVGTNRYGDAQYSVNGTAYSAPQNFEWNLGSSQVLSAIPQTLSTYKLLFQSWSNGGDTTQTITVNSDLNQYIANFKIQYKVQATALPGGISSLVNVTGGNLFYDSSSTANISIAPLSVPFNGTTYYFQRWLGAGIGSYTGTNPSFQITVNNFINQIAIYDTINTGINQLGSEIPNKFALMQNYPNPFNPVTIIKFNLPNAGLVSLKLYDVLGKEVDNLFKGSLSAGYYQMNFNASFLSSGIYFYRLETENFSDIKRMVLVK